MDDLQPEGPTEENLLVKKQAFGSIPASCCCFLLLFVIAAADAVVAVGVTVIIDVVFLVVFATAADAVVVVGVAVVIDVVFLVVFATAADAVVVVGVAVVVVVVDDDDDDVQVTLISVLSPPTVTMSNITCLCVWSSVSVIVYLLLNPESRFFCSSFHLSYSFNQSLNCDLCVPSVILSSSSPTLLTPSALAGIPQMFETSSVYTSKEQNDRALLSRRSLSSTRP